MLPVVGVAKCRHAARWKPLDRWWLDWREIGRWRASRRHGMQRSSRKGRRYVWWWLLPQVDIAHFQLTFAKRSSANDRGDGWSLCWPLVRWRIFTCTRIWFSGNFRLKNFQSGFFFLTIFDWRIFTWYLVLPKFSVENLNLGFDFLKIFDWRIFIRYLVF